MIAAAYRVWYLLSANDYQERLIELKKKSLLFLTALLLITALLVACGNGKTISTQDEKKPAETTVVLETTSAGGTVELDSEGNKITKDENGKVTAVEDESGKPVDVVQYVTTHTWIEYSSDTGSVDDPSKDSGSDSNKTSSGKSGSGSGRDTGSTNAQGEIVEGEIPKLIATYPPEDEYVELDE